MVIGNGNGTNGNSSCNGSDVSKRTVEAILCTVFLLCGAVSRCLVLRHHFLATALFWDTHFKMSNGGSGVEEIDEKAKQ
jgi:hypothetical protein